MFAVRIGPGISWLKKCAANSFSINLLISTHMVHLCILYLCVFVFCLSKRVTYGPSMFTESMALPLKHNLLCYKHSGGLYTHIEKIYINGLIYFRSKLFVQSNTKYFCLQKPRPTAVIAPSDLDPHQYFYTQLARSLLCTQIWRDLGHLRRRKGMGWGYCIHWWLV